jgi:hypothetical protein
MNNGEQLRQYLIGGNGHASAPTEENAKQVARKLQGLLASLERGREQLSRDDLDLLLGIGHHIERGTFDKIASRRGGSWRVVSALADRIVELEGTAILHMYSNEYAAQLTWKAAVTVAKTEIHMNALQNLAMEYGLDATLQVIDDGKQLLVNGARATQASYLDDVHKGYRR